MANYRVIGKADFDPFETEPAPARSTEPPIRIPKAPPLPEVIDESRPEPPPPPKPQQGPPVPANYKVIGKASFDPFKEVDRGNLLEDIPVVGPLFKPTAVERGVVGGSIDMGRMFSEAAEATQTAYDPAFTPDLTTPAPTGYEREVPSLEAIKPSMEDKLGTISRGLTYAGETLGQGVAQMAPTMLAGRVAGPAGAVPLSIIQNYGDVWQGFKQDKDILKAVQSGKITWQQAANLAAATGVVIGSIDAFSVDRVMAATGLKKEAVGEAIKTISKKMILQAAAKGFAWESTTEAIQSLLAQGSEIGLSGVDMDNVNWAERGMRVLNEWMAGGIAGAGGGGGLTAVEYHGQQKTTADTVTPPGGAVDDEDAAPAAGPPSDNEPQAAGSTAAAQPAQPAGAPARTTEEAAKPVAPVAGTPVVVTTPTTPDPTLAAAATGEPLPQTPKGEAETYTPEQVTRLADWAKSRGVGADVAAALAPETKPAPTQATAQPDILQGPQTTPLVAANEPAATVTPQTPVATERQEPSVPSTTAPATPAQVFPKLATAIETARQNELAQQQQAQPPVPQVAEPVQPAPQVNQPELTSTTVYTEPAQPEPPIVLEEPAGTPETPAQPAPEAIVAQAPEVQPEQKPAPALTPVAAEPQPEAAPVAKKPQRSAIARQLADETRLAVRERAAELRTEVADHPELNQIIDEVADELATTVKKGSPPAKAVKNLLEKAVEQVRARALVRHVERGMEAHDVATEQHAKAEEIALKRRTGTIEESTAGQQKERRGAIKGGVTAEVAATQSDKTLMALAKEHPEDKDLQAWLKARQKRATIKGKGSSQKIKGKRAEQTKLMEEAKARYVARVAAEGRTIAAEKEEARKIRESQEEEKHAEEASQTIGERQGQVTEEERREAAREKAEQSKAEKEGAQRRKKGEAAVKGVLDTVPQAGDRIVVDKMKSAAYIRHFIDQVKAALKAVGLELGDQRHINNLSGAENLAIFGRELLHDDTKKGEKGRKHPDFDLTEFHTAMALLRGGTKADIAAFRDLMSEGHETSMTHEVLQDRGDINKFRVASEAELEPSLVPSAEDIVGRGISVPTPEGTVTVLPISTAKGSSVLLKATKELRRSGTGFVHAAYNLIRHMHGRALTRMVGDIDVFFVSRANMDAVRGKGTVGAFANFRAKDRAAGHKGWIVIDQQYWDRATPQQRVELIQHEMTHAATSFAIDHNIRGSKEIVDKLRLSMKTQMEQQLGVIPAEFRHAFTNAREFVTHAFTSQGFQQWMTQYQVPMELRAGIEAMTYGRAVPTWWQTFTRAVANALAVYNPATQVNNYFEQVLKIHPHIMQAQARQTELATTAVEFPHGDPEQSQDYVDMFGKEALHRLRSQLLMGDNPFEAEPYMATMEASLDGAYQAAMRRTGLSRVADFMATKPLTTRMLKRLYVPQLGGKGGPFDQIIDMLESRQHDRSKQGKPGVKLIADFVRFAVTNARAATEIGELLWNSTIAQHDPSVPLSDPANKHISKAGELDYHTRLAHGRDHAVYNRMTAEQKGFVKDFIHHFQQEENTRIRLVVNNVLEEAIDRHNITLPPGWTVPLVTDWVMDGRIDRPQLPGNPRLPQPGDRTPEDQLLHDTLKGTAETLEGTAELRNIKGTYLPMLRDGTHIFSAQHEVATPPGAIKDKATGQPDDDKYLNEFVFASRVDYNNYLRQNNAKPEEQRDQIDGKPTIEHRDPATWQKVHHKDARAHRFYRVKVQNKVVEMDDNRNELEKDKADYDRQGFKTTLVGLRDEYMNQESSINSPQINRLIRSAQQASSSGTTSKKLLVSGINDLYIRQLAGQRASKRRLKRKAFKGYNRDLVDVMLQHNRVQSGHIANLRMAVKLGRAEKAMDEMLSSMQKNQYGSQADFYRLQRVVKEVRARWQGSTTRNERTGWNRFFNSLMAVAAIKNLATPSYHIINATGPLLAVHMAAPRFGTYKSYAAMSRTYGLLRAHRITGIGLLETGKEIYSAGKAGVGAARGNKMAALLPRDQADYDSFLKNRMTGHPLGSLFSRGLDELDRVNLGASSGIEAPELTEVGMNAAEKILHRTSRITRQMGEAGEHVNRSHVLLMNLILAKDAGMSDNDALDYAVDEVERSQGGYAAENQPNAFSQPGLKLPFQFKKYGGMYAQSYFNALIRTVKPFNTVADRKMAAKELAHMSILTTIFAGTRGLAFMEIGAAMALVAGALGLGKDDWEDWENWQQEMVEKIAGRKWAEVITRGVPRLFNIDLSERMAANSLVLYGDPESYKINDLLGYVAKQAISAGGGVITEGFLKNMQDAEDWWDYAEVLPVAKIFTDIGKAVWRLNNVTRNEYGTLTAEKYTPREAVEQVLGFKPASRSREYEPGGVGYTKQQNREWQHQRTLLMGEHYEAEPGEKHDAWQKIREFNKTVPREFRIDRGDLMKSRRKRQQDEREERRQRRQLEVAR